MTRHTAFIIAGMFGLTACAITPEVSSHVSDGVHLEQYKTFGLQTGKVFDPRSIEPGNQTTVGLALEADIREELERRGLKYQGQNPDLLFSYAAAKRPVYMGERQWQHEEGAIDILAKDATARIIWNAHLQSIIDPTDKTHRQMKEAIQRAFKNYPSVAH